jgi:ABC-type multidrug transport system ATPase subunit
MADVIVTKDLVKQFREARAVDGLSFNVPAGKIYGFLGQNGAGKSTTIRMLLTLITPTAGDIEIFGLNLRRRPTEILRRVGAIIEKPDLYKYMSALENLQIFATMSRVRLSRMALMDQLDKVGLAARATSKVATYSQGMKQRLGLAIALVHDPELIILDEPLNGLDPQGIADVRNLLLHLSRDKGKTLLVSSHLLGEMELIADSMLIIDRGKKVVEGKVSELFDPAATVVELETASPAEAFEKIRETELRAFASLRGERVLLKVHRAEVPGLVKRLVELGIEVYSLGAKHSLEDYFLSLTTENQHVAAFKN